MKRNHLDYTGQYQQILSLVIALSTWGNILAVLFTHGRITQELGREGILPWSSFFASDWPFRTPMAGFFVQWIVNSAYVLLPPPGDAYLFVLTRKRTLLIPARFIDDLSPSVILPPLVDQHVCLCGTVIHTLAPRGGSCVGLEPTASCIHRRRLVLLRIKCVFGGRSVHPTCSRVPGLREDTILRE